MEKKGILKPILIGLLALFALLYVLPSVLGTSALPSWYRDTFAKTLNYGLDLQGGLELRYAVDYKKAIGDNTLRLRESFIVEVARALARNEGKEDVDEMSDEALAPYRTRVEIKRTDFDTLSVAFGKAEDGEVMTTELIRRVDGNFQRVKKNDQEYLLRLSEARVVEIRDSSVGQTLQIIRKRIDAFGLVEPVVRQSGDSHLEVQLPGVKKAQMDVVRERIGQTAQLIFRIVDRDNKDFFVDTVRGALKGHLEENKDRGLTIQMLRENNDEYYLKATNKSEIVGFLKSVEVPQDSFVGYEMVEPKRGQVGVASYWRTKWLGSKIELTGEHLTRAVALYDQQNKPYISLEFDTIGARMFEETTSNNVGKDMAIMLDEDVYSDPRIKERIGGGRARIDLGGNRHPQELLAEAKALETVLSSGAYKAPVHKIHDFEVGPTLGREAVNSGKLSLLVGGLLVIVFMFIYYRQAGLFANIALSLNVLFIMAVLISFNSALTLPGIAGIVLTIGMAVDANVLIFERIREELRAGKSPRAAVEQGFGRAFWTIFDANVTTALAGVILLKFTSGPIYGFAVTLLVGILSSVFTAIVVTRMFLDMVVSKKGLEKLSI
jgi:preprotein translocase subunit SecD